MKKWLTLLVCLICASSFCWSASVADDEATRASNALARIAAYKQIVKDPTLKALSDQLNRDPGNQALWDSMLIRMPMSPMEMFQIRMESKFREYIIPKEVMKLHQRWQGFHPEAVQGVGAVQAAAIAAMVDAPIIFGVQALAATVGTNRNVAATYTPAPTAYDGEIQLAVNKNNTNQMVSGANTWNATCDTQSIFSSTDGGANWRWACAPSTGAFGISCPAGNSVLGSDPAVFWDNSNTAFFNYMLLCCNSACQLGTGNPSSSLVVAKSTDSGLNWTGHGVIINHLSSTSLGFDDKQFYAIDNTPASPFFNRHYQCWDNNNDEQFAYSSNGGVNWTSVNLPKGATGDLDLGCEMAVGSTGTIHLVFDGLTCGTTCSAEKTYYTRSTNGGAAWSTPVLIKNHNVVSFHTNAKPPAQDERGINPFGAIDVDNSGGAFNGRLYFSFTDATSTANMSTADVYIRYSTDNGATWSADVKVNDDTTSTLQFHPFLAVDQTNGAVLMGWHDARNDAANRRVDFYMSRSTNGGVTWEANTKVSQPSSEFGNNPTISYTDESANNSGNNPNQFGEYLGLDAHGGTAYMSWCDSRPYFPAGTTNAQKENPGFASVTFTTSTDTTPPTTSLTSPTAGSTLSGTVTVSANASDNVGVTNVEFYAGASLIGSDASSPYSISWDTTTVTNGSYNLTSKAYDAAGNNATSSPVNVTVNNVAGPPALTAAYSATYKAPACGSGGKSCDTGTSIINGRDTMSGGNEPNQPNNINSACADGTSGTYHSDESIDRMVVATNDGSAFAGGKTVTVSVTVWCYTSSPASDSLDLYYTSNATTPTWTLIGTQACPAGGAQTLTRTYTLPSTGTNHAVRANYRYQGAASSCSAGAYDDHDDLVFGVTNTADTTPPTTSITSPANGATVSGTITISANASDNVGVTNVEFYQGTTLIGSDSTSPYSVSWNTTLVANGPYSLTSKAFDAAGNNATSTAVNVTVNNVSVPDLMATFNATFLAPACPAGGKSCDTGASLVNGRGTMTGGNETNRPNTINNSCADGNSGTYHSDESIDRVKIATNDSTAFASGKAVTITYTVYCFSSADKIDIYRTATIPGSGSPTWTLIGTQTCTAAGIRTFTAGYTLPAGANQAVRANFRYNGAASACTTGAYDDRDDLVFGVQ